MHRQLLRTGAAVGAGLMALAAPAAEFTVGGVTVKTAEEGWEIHEAKAPPVNIGGGGIDGNLPSEARLLLLKGPDNLPLAAVVVYANRGTGRSLTLRGSCPTDPPNDRTYMVRHGHPMGGPRTCALIGGPYDGASIATNVRLIDEARRSYPFIAPANAYFFEGYAFAQNGARFGVTGLVSTPWAGLPGEAPAQPAPGEMPSEVAAWGDALGLSIKKAHEGLFSRSTTLPPFLPATSPKPQ